MRFALIALILMSILSISTYANEISKCSCDNVMNVIELSNPYGIDVTYTIENFGNGAKLAKQNTKKVLIPSGQTFQFVNEYVSACNVYGIYDVNTLISDNVGNKRTVKTTLNIKQCENLKAQISSPSSVCVGNQYIIDVTLKNEGNFEDDIELTVDGYEDVTLPFNNKTIDPGKTLNFEVTFDAKGNGVFLPSLYIMSRKSGQKIKIPLRVEFEKCSEIIFDLDLDYKYCLGYYDKVLTIENRGTREQELEVDIDGQTVSVNFNDDEVSVDPGEIAEVDLEIEAEDVGDGKITVTVGDNKKEYYLLILDDFECNRIDLKKHYYALNNGSGVLRAEITNNGIEKSSYKAFEYDNFTSLLEEFTLDTGQSTILDIGLDTSLEPGKHYFRLYVTSDRNVEYQKDIVLEIKKPLEINNDFYIWIVVIIVLIIFTLLGIFSDNKTNRNNKTKKKKKR